jgi:polyisoprenyl-teichoic acid--peptidoglycan teichoic acid transferase
MQRSPELNRKPRPTQLPTWFFVGLVTLFGVAAIATAGLTFAVVRDVMASLRSPAPAELTLKAEAAQAGVSPENLDALGEAPLQPENSPSPVPWDGSTRANLLLMGLDYRDWESYDVPRTDTMILLSLDPANRSIGILSIPRDLWVAIPGFDMSKINQAYRLGEVYDTPGGGPGLAIETVEGLLGMQIDYYAQIDFNAFESFIDELGGISITVPEAIEIDPLGDNNNQVLDPGEQTLPGYLALAYARARNTAGSDFDRAERQHQVILAIRDRILSAEMLPTLATNAPGLYQSLSAGVRTNLNLLQVVRMAWVAQQIPEENIHRGVIGVDQVEFDFSFDGQDILRPIPEAILQLRDEVFFAGPIAPAATQANPQEMVRNEDATVSVLNGTLTAGLASQTADYLLASGIIVAEPDNASETYLTTTLIDYTGKPHTVAFITELMNIQPENVYHRYDETSEADIVITLGEDWAIDNPMP